MNATLASLRHHVTGAIERGEAVALEAQTTPDARYGVHLEYCGYESPRYVLRFCRQFISAHTTSRAAIRAAWAYHKKRTP